MVTDSDMKAEQLAVAEVKRLAREMAPHARLIWHWGDGHGGGILKMIADAAGIAFFSDPESATAPSKKAIPRALSKAVFERDAYRCVACGGHIDLTCDHIVAESRGGPTTYENLQTMCRSCNSRKGAR